MTHEEICTYEVALEDAELYILKNLIWALDDNITVIDDDGVLDWHYM